MEVEIGLPVSEAYSLPMIAKSLVGSVMANSCGSHYPLHTSMVEASSQRVMIDKAISVPKYVRRARMSYHSHQLLRKMFDAMPGPRVEYLSNIWGEKLLSIEKENSSNLEKQSASGKYSKKLKLQMKMI